MLCVRSHNKEKNQCIYVCLWSWTEVEYISEAALLTLRVMIRGLLDLSFRRLQQDYSWRQFLLWALMWRWLVIDYEQPFFFLISLWRIIQKNVQEEKWLHKGEKVPNRKLPENYSQYGVDLKRKSCFFVVSKHTCNVHQDTRWYHT